MGFATALSEHVMCPWFDFNGWMIDEHVMCCDCRKVDPDTLKMTPRCLLVGHTAPVLCLSRASIVQDNNFLVSSSENGEMCTWDLVDGKCKENTKLTQVHTSIQAYHMANCVDIRLFCNGYYAEILVMDPFSLEVIFSLSSKVKPDWISALHVSSTASCFVLAYNIFELKITGLLHAGPSSI